ncbi:Low calcium response locus protein H [Neochlamydia sp. TUME1]|nr:Low calcium response locus protein H [Neochlamydia sp. TUME1]
MKCFIDKVKKKFIISAPTGLKMESDDIGEFKITKKVKMKLKNKKLLKKQLAQGKTAQQILEFSDETMVKFYGAAYRLFDHRRYVEAAQAFLFLVTLNPYNHEYWVGLGMCSQLNKDYEAAIDAYEMAAICRIDNPVPYFYLAKCLFALHDRESALQALDLAIEYASNHPEFLELQHHAENAKRLLLKDI